MATCKSVCALIFCSVETILLSGVVFGWDFLLPILTRNGIFCPNKTSIVNEDDLHIEKTIEFRCKNMKGDFDLVFMLSVFTPYVFILIAGVIFDYLGTRVTRLIALVLFISGCMIVSFATIESVLLYIGMPMISCGGGLILLTNLQISNWFFVQRSTVICWFIGCFSTSSGLFLLMNFLEFSSSIPENYIEFRYMFWGLAVLSVLPIITTLAILPLHKIKEDENSLDNFAQDATHMKMDSKKIYRQTRLEGLTLDPNDRSELEERRSVNILIEKKYYCEVSCNATYILHVFWFAILQIEYWWLFHRQHTSLGGISETHQVFRYEVFHYAPIAMLPLPVLLIGLLMDCRRSKIGKNYPDSDTIHIKASFVPIVMVTIISLLLACMVFGEIKDVSEFNYVVDALLIIHKPMVLATSACFIFQVFPLEFFGRLVGVCLMVGGVIGVQYFTLGILYDKVVSASNIPWIIEVGIVILVVLSVSHPIHLIVRGNQLETETERRTLNVIWATDNATYDSLEEIRRKTPPPKWKSTEL